MIRQCPNSIRYRRQNVLAQDLRNGHLGVGGLGHVALQALHELCGARTIAVDRSEAARTLATELGAHHVLDGGPNVVEEIKQLTHGGAHGVRQILGVLALAKKHGGAVVDDAAKAAIDIGVLTYRIGREEFRLALAGGFCEVRNDKVIVLADSAERPEEVDRGRAERARQRAERRLSGRPAGDEPEEIDYARAARSLARAQARLDVATAPR